MTITFRDFKTASFWLSMQYANVLDCMVADIHAAQPYVYRVVCKNKRMVRQLHRYVIETAIPGMFVTVPR